MAESPSHKFGQIIGNLLESTLYGSLREIVDKHSVYLDYKHPRAARSGKNKVSWHDSKGNSHDLDYVLEKGGSETVVGSPKAFIETAWRRHTKHSRNKAQEMQGAIIPLAETYGNCFPFLGVVLAGVFTEGSLKQLRSHGFSILYYPYDAICEAFGSVGIDAAFDEDTPDIEVAQKVAAFERLSDQQKAQLVQSLVELRKENLLVFLTELETSLQRNVFKILVLALHGSSTVVTSIAEAVAFIEGYDEAASVGDFVRYEIQVEYSNTDRIACNFTEKRTALLFLQSLR